MRAVCYREDDEDQAAHDEARPEPVHLHVHRLALLHVRRHGEVGRHSRREDQDRADPEVPAEIKKLARQAGEEDAGEEAQRRGAAVQAEDEILARAGPVDAAEQHDAGGEEGRGSEALQGAAEVEHQLVAREAGDDRPEEEPEEPELVDGQAAVHVGETAEGQEEGGGDEREGAGGPDGGRLGDVELGDQGG